MGFFSLGFRRFLFFLCGTGFIAANYFGTGIHRHSRPPMVRKFPRYMLEKVDQVFVWVAAKESKIKLHNI